MKSRASRQRFTKISLRLLEMDEESEMNAAAAPGRVPPRKGRVKAPRTPAQQEATRKALAALAERRKVMALTGEGDPAVKAAQAEEKLRRQAAARAIIEGEHKTVAAELAEIKAMVAQTKLDAAEAAAKAKPAPKKKRVVVVSESESEEEEVVVVKRKPRAAAAAAPPPPPPPPPPVAPPAPEPPAKPKRPQLDRALFTRA